MLVLKLYAVFLILVTKTTRRSLGSGVLSMKLIHFENPDSKLADGSCCDATESSITLCGSCEYYFKFCLSDIGSNNCNLSSVTTSVLTSANYYIFQPSFPSQPCDQIISNPLVIPVQRWMGVLSIKITVYDYDSANSTKDDRVSLMEKNVTLSATRFGAGRKSHPVVLIGEQRASGLYPKLTLKLSMKCDENYLIPNCSDYCIDTDDVTGHYTCDFVNGLRVCHRGWYGPRCNTFCIPQNDTSGHFSCEQNSGTKICLPGWLDASTNCTREDTTNKHSLNASVLEKVPQKLSSVHSSIRQSLQQPTILGISPSYSDITPTRSLANSYHDKVNGTTATYVPSQAVEVWVSESQVLAHSATVAATPSLVRKPFEEGPRTAIASLHDTYSQISTITYVKGTEPSNRRDFWETSISDSALSNRELLATVHSTVRSTMSKADSSLYRDNFITSQTDFHPTQSIEHEDKSYQTSFVSPASLLDSELLHSTSILIDQTSFVSPASLLDSELLHSTSILIDKTMISRVLPFTLESHYLRTPYEKAGPSISYSLETQHRQTVSTATLSLLVVSLHSAALSSESTHSSTILERRQTGQEALSDEGGLSKLWNSYQHYLLTAAGCLVVAVILMFVAARYKRKNRVQSLRHSPSDGEKERTPTSTVIDGNSMEDHNPYVLLQKASNTNLNTINHQSSTSVRSGDLLTRTNTGDSPRCPSSLAARISNDVEVDKYVTEECWMPRSIKCWTPVEIQTQVEGSNELTMYDMETECATTNNYLIARECSTRADCHTPWDCSTQRECLTPRILPTSGEYLTPRKSPFPGEHSKQRKSSAPNFLQKSDQYPWGNTDNLKNDIVLSRVHGKPENFRIDRSQMFINNHNSQFSIGYHTLQSTELCTPKLLRAGNTRIVNKEKRSSTPGFERLVGGQSIIEQSPKIYPKILLTESNICNNVSKEHDLSPSFINRNTYDSISLCSANATSCSWTSIRENQTRSQLLTPYWPVGNPGSSAELRLSSSQQTSILDRPKSPESVRLPVLNTSSHFR